MRALSTKRRWALHAGLQGESEFYVPFQRQSSEQNTLGYSFLHRESFLRRTRAITTSQSIVYRELTRRATTSVLSDGNLVHDARLRQLLWTRHAVVRTIVPVGVTRALRAESDGKSDQIQSQH